MRLLCWAEVCGGEFAHAHEGVPRWLENYQCVRYRGVLEGGGSRVQSVLRTGLCPLVTDCLWLWSAVHLVFVNKLPELLPWDTCPALS